MVNFVRPRFAPDGRKIGANRLLQAAAPWASPAKPEKSQRFTGKMEAD
jgi:hypothetical protein